MTTRFFNVLLVGIVAALAFQSVSAQDDRAAAVAAAGDKYVISAKAGGVNYVEGGVGVLRTTGKSGWLSKRDEITVGDRVSTGPDGRAEVLLNPGSFLRVGPNSAFEFKSTSLDDLYIKLDHGTAIFEVFASREFKIRVATPHAKMLLIESGVFRVDVQPDGGAKVSVIDGKAMLGDHTATILRKGKSAILKDGVSTIGKIEKDKKDDLEAWSRSRGKELAKMSAKLKNQAMRNSLINSFNSGGWGMYNSFGLWVFNPVYGCYTFLPFGYGWYSPYGYGFGNCLCFYNLPPVIYYPPASGGGSGSGGSTGPTVTAIRSQGDRSPTPPFERIQNNGGISRGILDTGGGSRGSRGDGPVYSPPVYVPPTVPAPAASETGSKPRDH